MADTRQLKFVLDAQDKTKQAFNQVALNLRTLEQSVNKLQPMFQKMAIGGAAAFTAIGYGSKEAIKASNEMESAMIGLNSVANAFGQSASTAKEAAIALASDGLMSVKDAASGLKNLLASGFSLDEATKLMYAFKDAAAFNRQGTLEFGQAIEGATQGIKNQNSVMVDNAGITKNLSMILTEAGYSQQDLMKVTSDAGVRQALYNGILKEASTFQGDAARMSETLGGKLAELNTKIFNAKAAIGDALNPAMTKMLEKMTPILDKIISWVKEHPKLTAILVLSAGVLSAFTLAVGVLGLALPGIITGVTYLAGVMIALRLAFVTITWPVELIAITLFSVATAAIWVYKNFDKVKATTVSLAKVLYAFAKDAAANFFNLKGVLTTVFTAIGQVLTGNFKEAGETIKRDVSAAFSNTLQSMKDFSTAASTASSEVYGPVNQVTEAVDNINNVVPPATENFGAGMDKMKQKAEELQGKMTTLSDNITETWNNNADAIKETADAIEESIKKINNIQVDYSKGTVSLNQNYAEAYVAQEEKVRDLEAQWASEDDQSKKDQLLAELTKEREVLEGKKTIELAYQDEINEARRRAHLTEFERKLEDLAQTRNNLSQEYELKYKEAYDELEIQVNKYNELKGYQEQAYKNYLYFLTLNEKATIDSVNREIDKWNTLAKAMNDAKQGKTTSKLNSSAVDSALKGGSASPITINITGNDFFGERGLLEKVGSQLMGALKQNAKL